jgi:hypothetical protein
VWSPYEEELCYALQAPMQGYYEAGPYEEEFAFALQPAMQGCTMKPVLMWHHLQSVTL